MTVNFTTFTEHLDLNIVKMQLHFISDKNKQKKKKKKKSKRVKMDSKNRERLFFIGNLNLARFLLLLFKAIPNPLILSREGILTFVSNALA